MVPFIFLSLGLEILKDFINLKLTFEFGFADFKKTFYVETSVIVVFVKLENKLG